MQIPRVPGMHVCKIAQDERHLALGPGDELLFRDIYLMIGTAETRQNCMVSKEPADNPLDVDAEKT